MYNYLDFEKPVADLDAKIFELRKIKGEDEGPEINNTITQLEERSFAILKELYKNLNPWQKVQVARHPNRPHFVDFCEQLFTDVTPLAGDRNFGDDQAIQAGFARFQGQPIAFLGHEKGHDTQTRIKHNFGSARPEGYRKAIRIMELANRFGLPVISLVDTAGAYPGVSAEERGQAEAIATSTAKMLELEVPTICVIMGEGGSGGAIAIAAANKVFMLEHAIYSVISPEGAASILWRDATRAIDAATNMRITAQDLYKLKIIDGIIPEPIGGAHRNREEVIEETGRFIAKALQELSLMDGPTLKNERAKRFLDIGRNL